MMLDSAVAQLNCDATCVSTCTAAALTIDAKARCLDTCLCYATPAVTVPATPVVAPATPVVAPATPVVTPVAAPATPVVEPVVAPVVTPVAQEAAPVAADAAATPVVVDAEPVEAGAAQALFLNEANLVHTATGALSGAFLVALILVLITLVGAAFLHLQEKKDIVNKAQSWVSGFRKTAASSENEEYLLIK